VAKVTQARSRLAEVVEIRPGARSSHVDQAPSGPIMLAPSDFAFLWDECPRCFYLKVVRKEGRPRTPFPAVFGTIDRAMKSFYMGQRTESLDLGMPAGTTGGADRSVRSSGLTIPGSTTLGAIRGSLDALVHCDDGSVGVVDFKTVEPKPDHVDRYSRQLHAYALALEQPWSGPVTQVSALGLLCFSPESFTSTQTATLCGDIKWLEIERDNPSFFRFLIEVMSVIGRSQPPPASPSCVWCRWRTENRAAS